MRVSRPRNTFWTPDLPGVAGGAGAPPAGTPAYGVPPQPPQGMQPPAPAPQAPAPLAIVRDAGATGYPAANIPQTPPQGALPSQPAGASASPAPGAPAPAPAGLDLNARLDGANVPAELRGRTVGEAIGLYNGMRQSLLQLTQGQPVAPGAAPAPVAPGAPAPAAPQGPTKDDFWRDPIASIQRVVQSTVQQTLAPQIADSAVNMAQRAMDTVKAMVGPQEFSALEPQIIAKLQGATPDQLANPELWRHAFFITKGEADLAARQSRPATPAPTAPVPAGVDPNRFVPAPSGAVPQAPPAFFTEAPTAPAVVTAPGNGSSYGLSTLELQVASAMGMTPQAYMLWKGGVQR